MCASSHCQETACVNAGSLRQLKEQKLITVISYTCGPCCDMQEDPVRKVCTVYKKKYNIHTHTNTQLVCLNTGRDTNC